MHAQINVIFTKRHAELHITKLYVGLKASTLSSSDSRLEGLVGTIVASKDALFTVRSRSQQSYKTYGLPILWAYL